MGTDGLGLSPASAPVWPRDFGQGAHRPQSSFSHLQTKDSNAKHPTGPFVGHKCVPYINVLGELESGTPRLASCLLILSL